MKKIACYIALATVATSCAFAPKSSISGDGGEVTGIRGTAMSEPTPYGMVLVERGSMQLGPNADDSTWNIKANPEGMSVESFWMDETEVSNAKYRQFVFWVRDSIIRERLADPAYGGDEEYKIEEDDEGNPIKPYLNWKKPIPWKNPTEDEQRAIESVYKVSDEAPMISKDTAYYNDNGEIVRETISRRLSSDYDFLNTYIVNIYPDTTVWINDFENAYNEPYTRLYFSHPGYSDYPVVGVSWEQANAFAFWRTEYLRRSLGRQGVYIEPYRLPTEAEWEYAARAGMNENRYPWAGDMPISDDGCFYANLKPGEGNYVRDGNLITSRCGTYDPNDFGLYDMAGNVSEWTSTAYTESVDMLRSDINPEYRYNAAKEDPYRMKRKVIRGGSWKDVAHNVRSDLRAWEYQNEQRSYVGFRCVRTQIGFAKGNKK